MFSQNVSFHIAFLLERTSTCLALVRSNIEVDRSEVSHSLALRTKLQLTSWTRFFSYIFVHSKHMLFQMALLRKSLVAPITGIISNQHVNACHVSLHLIYTSKYGFTDRTTRGVRFLAQETEKARKYN